NLFLLDQLGIMASRSPDKSLFDEIDTNQDEKYELRI
ncbi:unnamed protein product, partial [Rotaria sp. Silwood2]